MSTNERPTPETQRAKVGRYDTTARTGLARYEYIVRDSHAEYVPIEVSARLEQQRDELLEALEKMVEKHSNLMAKQICKCDACKTAKTAIAAVKGNQ